MRTVRTVRELRAGLAGSRRPGRTIGLVPTMGAFHDGHLSLIDRARAQCEVVVVSLFVNPTQFNESTDLDAYPRDERRDHELALAAGVDYVFAPRVEEVYPDGFSTSVSVAGVTDGLEGEHRGRGHFDGVTTVVAKLFNIVGPDAAYFGQKDAQQAAVVTRMARDLNLSLRIEICPTIRASDGLALSSRNVRLSPDERRRATALNLALETVRRTIRDGERDARAAVRAGLAVLSAAGVQAEYLALVSPREFKPVQRIDGDVLVVVAAYLGETRLIDNALINVLPTARAHWTGEIPEAALT